MIFPCRLRIFYHIIQSESPTPLFTNPNKSNGLWEESFRKNVILKKPETTWAYRFMFTSSDNCPPWMIGDALGVHILPLTSSLLRVTPSLPKNRRARKSATPLPVPFAAYQQHVVRSLIARSLARSLFFRADKNQPLRKNRQKKRRRHPTPKPVPVAT